MPELNKPAPPVVVHSQMLQKCAMVVLWIPTVGQVGVVVVSVAL